MSSHRIGWSTYFSRINTGTGAEVYDVRNKYSETMVQSKDVLNLTSTESTTTKPLQS